MLELVENDNEICLQGEYKAAELMMFEVTLHACLARLESAKDLNLTHVIGSDSGLIALLLSYQRFSNEKHWQVKLINASDGVKGLLELSQLSDFFTLVDKAKS
jgi:ABC-type transporter Mla MlaB component